MYTHCYLTGVDGTFIGILVFANANTKYKITKIQIMIWQRVMTLPFRLLQIQNTKYKIQNAKYKIQNTKYKIQNTKYKIQW